MTRATKWMVAVFAVVSAFALGIFLSGTIQLSEATTSKAVEELQLDPKAEGTLTAGQSLSLESDHSSATGVLKPQAQGGANNILLMPGAGGKVGIGTTNPTAFLELESDESKTVAITISDVEQSNFDGHRARPGPSIVQENDGAVFLTGRGYDGEKYRPLGRVRIHVDGPPGLDDMPGRIAFSTTADGDTSPTTRMVIKNDGYVGIGTMNPEELLSLESDDADIQLDTITDDSTQASNVRLLRARAGRTSVANGDPLGNINAWGFDGTDYQKGPAINFFVDGDPGPSDMPGRIQFLTTPDGLATREITMTIKNDGKVGIGTENPLDRLEVSNGNIRVSGGAFIDDGIMLSAPDYVFENDYPLMPLEELQVYISAHKRLPNVPSAENIKANGLNLSEFQMRLLEKVEELTLYTLQQQQALKDQQRQIARLETLLGESDR